MVSSGKTRIWAHDTFNSEGNGTLKGADFVLILALDFFGATGQHYDLGTITYIAHHDSIAECQRALTQIEANQGSGNLATFLEGSMTRYFAANAKVAGEPKVKLVEMGCVE